MGTFTEHDREYRIVAVDKSQIPLDDVIEIVKECAEKFYTRNFQYYGSVDLNPIIQGYKDSIIANLRKHANNP